MTDPLPSERIIEIMMDSDIPQGYQPKEMDWIHFIIQYLDEQHSKGDTNDR